MSRFWLLAVGGGVASVLIHSLAAVAPGGLMLANFAALPLYLVGFGMGLTAAVTAGATAGATATAALVMLLPEGGITATGFFFFVTVLPAVVFIRQALLSRPDDQGQQVWYPAGHMLFTLSVMGAVLFTCVALLLSLLPDGFQGTIRKTIGLVAGMVFAPDASDLKEQFITQIAAVLPGVTAAWWLVLNVINAALAQGVLVRFQRNIRPTPEIVSLELPNWFPLAAVAAAATVAGLYLPGWIGYYGGNLAIFLIVPFFFVGLAVVHAWCRNKSARTFLLILFYVMLIFFGWLVLVVAVLGLIEQWVGLRRRFA